MVKKNKYSHSRSQHNRKINSRSRSRIRTRKLKNILYDHTNKVIKNSDSSEPLQYNILLNSSISPDSHKQPIYEKSSSPMYLSESDYSSDYSNDDVHEDRENIGNYDEKKENQDLSYASITSKNDMKIYKIKCLLDEKRKTIIKKNKEIKELAKENAYLENVITDYDKVCMNNLDEKEKQKRALKILSKHIRNISKDLKKDEHELHRVKSDQKMIIEEIEKLKDEMSDILNATDIPGKNYVSSDNDSDENNDHDEN